MDENLITSVATPTANRPRHRWHPTAAAAAAAASIIVVATPAAGSAASDPSVRTPLTCAAAYIGVPVNTLSAGVVERQHASGGLGFEIVLDALDTAEQAKLAAITGPPQFNVFEVRQIIQDHDDLEHLITQYAVSTLLPARIASLMCS
jgi:hypothetical protein